MNDPSTELALLKVLAEQHSGRIVNEPGIGYRLEIEDVEL